MDAPLRMDSKKQTEYLVDARQCNESTSLSTLNISQLNLRSSLSVISSAASSSATTTVAASAAATLPIDFGESLPPNLTTLVNKQFRLYRIKKTAEQMGANQGERAEETERNDHCNAVRLLQISGCSSPRSSTATSPAPWATSSPTLRAAGSSTGTAASELEMRFALPSA